MAKKKLKKKKTAKSQLRFEISSGMNLPEQINWQEEEVMDALSSFFKQKIKQGIHYVSMAEILKLFGHSPEPHHKHQVFEIADVSDKNSDHNGMRYKGKYYPMSNYTYH